MNILDEICAYKKIFVEEAKKNCSYGEIEKQALAQPKASSFFTALKNKDFSQIKVIAEVKKASPSKGVIEPNFDHMRIAQTYLENGANALSILTDEKYFQGHARYLQEIVQSVSLPALRKEFIVDEYQILEAKAWGASAILLIVDCLTSAELKRFHQFAKELDLDVLVETHREEEVHEALAAGAEMIGVNNRNLRTFETSLETTFSLRPLVPEEFVFISESGISTAEDIRRLLEIKTDAVLVGESLMRSQGSLLRDFLS